MDLVDEVNPVICMEGQVASDLSSFLGCLGDVPLHSGDRVLEGLPGQAPALFRVDQVLDLSVRTSDIVDNLA